MFCGFLIVILRMTNPVCVSAFSLLCGNEMFEVISQFFGYFSSTYNVLGNLCCQEEQQLLWQKQIRAKETTINK